MRAAGPAGGPAHLASAQGDPAGGQRLLEQAAECFDAAGQPLDADRCRTPLPTAAPAPLG